MRELKITTKNGRKIFAYNLARFKVREQNFKGQVIFDAMTYSFWLGNDFYDLDSVIENVYKSVQGLKYTQSEKDAIFQKLITKEF